MAQYRQNRIAEEIKKNLDRIIREELRDPRVCGTFSITRVEPTRDLRIAKVYISVLEEEGLEDMIKALKGASGLLRHALGARLSVRHTPELIFLPTAILPMACTLRMCQARFDGGQDSNHEDH